MSQKYWYLLTVDHIAGSQGRANEKILALLLLPLPQPPLLLRLLLLHALLPSYLSPSFLFLLLPSCPSSFFPALLPSLRSYLSCQKSKSVFDPPKKRLNTHVDISTELFHPMEVLAQLGCFRFSPPERTCPTQALKLLLGQRASMWPRGTEHQCVWRWKENLTSNVCKELWNDLIAILLAATSTDGTVLCDCMYAKVFQNILILETPEQRRYYWVTAAMSCYLQATTQPRSRSYAPLYMLTCLHWRSNDNSGLHLLDDVTLFDLAQECSSFCDIAWTSHCQTWKTKQDEIHDMHGSMTRCMTVTAFHFLCIFTKGYYNRCVAFPFSKFHQVYSSSAFHSPHWVPHRMIHTCHRRGSCQRVSYPCTRLYAMHQRTKDR